MDNKIKSKGDAITGIVMGAIILTSVFIVIVPTTSARIGDGKLMLNSYSPFEKTTNFGDSWMNWQWKDTFNGNSYSPFEKTTNFGDSWINWQWKDTFNGNSYSPLERTTTIGGFTWTDTFNGKSYVPSYPMPSYSTPSSFNSYSGW